MTKSLKILVAMSGGVDSSTAAAILCREGHEVVGVTMRLPAPAGGTEGGPSCCGTGAAEDARRVAEQMGFPFYEIDMREVFEREVVDYFCRSYLNGRTPNPCVVCNSRLKFGRLLDLADAMDAACVATGHHARVENRNGGVRLKKGADPEKDQSYFLHALTERQLGRTRFPIGEFTKDRVRELARSEGLPVSEKPGSQDICFLGSTDYRRFVRGRHPEAPEEGPIVNVDGEVLGTHQGITRYTIGQRKGLGIAAADPLYVVEIDSERNRVVVGEQKDLMTDSIRVSGVNWIGKRPGGARRLRVKTRYRQEERAARVEPLSEEAAAVRFERPLRRPAPGQSAVFYEGDTVIGGGVIEND